MVYKRKVICRIPKADPELVHRIEVLEAKVAHYHPDGVSINTNKQTVYVNRATTVAVTVAATMQATAIKLYRGETLIHEVTNSEGFSYQDSITAQAAGTISYHVEATIGGVDYEASVNVSAVADSITGITWTGGSISPASVEVGGTATLTKGTVTAVYASGATEVVTDSAVFSAQRGTINGTTYTAPNTDGSDTISVTYGGKTASNTLSVTVTASYLTVQIGSGADYASAVFTDTQQTLSNNMAVVFEPNNGDHLFIKVDKRNVVTNLYTNPTQGQDYEIPIDGGTVVGDYKYYTSTILLSAGALRCKINKTI